MGNKINLSEIALISVTLSIAIGTVVFALVFLLVLVRGPVSATANPTAVSESPPSAQDGSPSDQDGAPSGSNGAAPRSKLKEPPTAGPTIETPANTPGPTPTKTPLPTLYAHKQPVREFGSFPIPILPTEISARTLPTSAPQENDPASITHVIQPNENLYRIARRYGVSVRDIIALNNLARPGIINPGRTLLIPSPNAELRTSRTDLVLPAEQASADTPEAATLVEALPTISPADVSPVPTSEPPQAPEPEITPTAVREPDPTPLPEPTAVAEPPAPLYAINGLPIESIAVLSPEVRQHVREIFARGQSLGNSINAFSKVGDSTTGHPYFLAHFDGSSYNLGPYEYLQPAVDQFPGSFGRKSIANRVGLHSWTATDPAWASNTICLANESPIACEIRLHRPIIILIRLGSNDRGASDLFDANMRQAVQIALDNGVIPVLGTKPDRFEGSSNINNIIIRQIAADYRIPLWELDLAASTVPGRGLGDDNVHLTSLYPHDYALSWALQRGHAIQNISALMALQAIVQELGLQAG